MGTSSTSCWALSASQSLVDNFWWQCQSFRPTELPQDALLITRWKMYHPTPDIGGWWVYKHYKHNLIFMERCDENNKIYSRQRTTTKYTRAAANMFSTSKEGVSNAKPYCPSQPCTFTASHPGVRTTKTHRRYSIKTLSKLRRFPCCFKAPWSLLFMLACATLPARWVTPWFRT